MPLFIGTDIGGTFTDLVGYDSQKNALFYGKRLTDYGDLVEGVLDCLSDVGLEPRSVDILKHGTTQVINTLLERRGAKTVLLTTRGFRDILEIGRAGRPLAFRLDYRRLPPLVPRELRYEIDERIDGEGRVLAPLQDAELDTLAAEFRQLKIEAVAVSFLNAYRNPVHEEQAVRRLREQLPGVYVTCGSGPSRGGDEYEGSPNPGGQALVGPRPPGY